MSKHIKLYEDFVNESNLDEEYLIESLIVEAEDLLAKIEARYEKKIDSLLAKADRHYNKEEEVSAEDIKDVLIPLVHKMKQADIALAKMKAAKKPQYEARIEKVKEMMQKLKDKYEKEYQNYKDDVARERMGGGRFGRY
jgi:acyl-CoA reductase-like NAD-dependent aldehyde dehydrogenase